jgi:hypothetical protein
MPTPAGLRFRAAGPRDAHAIAGYLLPLWTKRLASPDPAAGPYRAGSGGLVALVRPVSVGA